MKNQKNHAVMSMNWKKLLEQARSQKLKLTDYQDFLEKEVDKAKIM